MNTTAIGRLIESTVRTAPRFLALAELQCERGRACVRDAYVLSAKGKMPTYGSGLVAQPFTGDASRSARLLVRKRLNESIINRP